MRPRLTSKNGLDVDTLGTAFLYKFWFLQDFLPGMIELFDEWTQDKMMPNPIQWMRKRTRDEMVPNPIQWMRNRIPGRRQKLEVVTKSSSEDFTETYEYKITMNAVAVMDHLENRVNSRRQHNPTLVKIADARVSLTEPC